MKVFLPCGIVRTPCHHCPKGSPGVNYSGEITTWAQLETVLRDELKEMKKK